MIELSKFLRAENESLVRLNSAKEACQEANAKLSVALEAGRDSTPARRVLQEAKRLVAFAEEDLARIRRQIEHHRHQACADLAAAMTADAASRISNRLAGFSIPK